MVAIPVVEDWTQQEKFVWERVASGEVADFNAAEGYGGDLSPKTPEGWPENRVLRPVFLETILLREPYRSNLTRRGVTILGARFTDVIELEGAELLHRLALANSLIEKGADLRRLRSKYPISFSDSKVSGNLRTNGLDIDASLLMRNGDFAEMDFVTAHVGGQLILSGSKVAGKLSMGAFRLDVDLLIDNVEFAEIDLVGAHIGGQLDLHGSKVTGKLNMNSLRVGRDLLMSDAAEFSEVELVGAHIDGQLNLNNSKVIGKLNMNSLRVEESLLMSAKAEFAQVGLVLAHISGQLNLNSSKVVGKLDMNSLRVEGDLIMESNAEFAEVELTSAYIGGQLSLRGSKVNGTLNCESIDVGKTVWLSDDAKFLGQIDLMFAKIGQNLSLAGATFTVSVDMTGSRLAGELSLGSAQVPPAVWQDNAALILRNATVDTIQDLTDAWPDQIDFNGFIYQRLGGYATEVDPMLERPVDWFEAWLGKQEHYSVQPYERLALCLKNYGKSEMATAIRYAGRERERKESTVGWRRIWLTAFKYSVGYGFRPWRALGWAAVLVLIGAAVLQISGEGVRNHMPYGFAYSFDMLLPVVKLREWHYKVDLVGWARYYFYAHKIAGYLLASFLIAGLSSLTGSSRESTA